MDEAKFIKYYDKVVRSINDDCLVGGKIHISLLICPSLA